MSLWLPLKEIPSKMYVEAVHDDYEGFRVLLKGDSDQSSMLRVSFDNTLSYRNTDESYLLKMWDGVSKDTLGKIFYIVEQSEYIDFFQKMTQQLYEDWEIKHYAIYTDTDCIEILSQNDPTVEWLN